MLAVSAVPAHLRRAALLALAACASAQAPAAQDIPRVPRVDTTVYVPRPLAPGASRPVPPEVQDPGGPPPRVTLVTTARPVVLLRDGAAPGTSGVVEARVRIDADGQRSLVYSERAAAPPDISAQLGCGPAAGRAIARLHTLADGMLALNDEGALVGAAQQLLCVAGYTVPPDGAFGEAMEQGVLAFQQDVNAAAVEAGQEAPLLETGVLDVETRQALEARARLRLGE